MSSNVPVGNTAPSHRHPNGPLRITVIVCTYNRCKDLKKALECLAAQILPATEHWDVIVVDNNSGDETEEIARDFCNAHSDRFRYLFESEQGLSHARNAGIRGSTGDVLVFVDDDVTFQGSWLQNLTAAFRSSKWAGVGGRVLPEQSFIPPKWLAAKPPFVLPPLALFDLGLEPCALSRAPFGANMAFRREMFQRYGLFRPDLGRCGDVLLSNEDTEFGNRLLSAGENLHYEPSAIVYHPVPPNRIKKRYFLAWWSEKGRADIREHGIAAGTRWIVAGVPLYILRRFVAWIVRWTFTFEPRERFSAKIKVWGRVGEIKECYRLARIQARSNATVPPAV